MPDVRFPVAMVGGVPVVTVPEEIDITDADELRVALLHTAARGHGTFVVDMTQTRFCDSAGLNTLLAAHRRAEAEASEMLLVTPGGTVLRVLEITGVDHVVHHFISLDEALAHASAAAARPPKPARRGHP